MSESVIDQNIYAELHSTAGAELTAELVDTFLEEAPGMLAELRSACAQGDAESFRRAAHSLKSNGNTSSEVLKGQRLRDASRESTASLAANSAMRWRASLKVAISPNWVMIRTSSPGWSGPARRAMTVNSSSPP